MAADDKKQQEMKEEIGMYLRKKDYYDILGIQKNSNDAQIKKAYKKLALRFHPDKNNTEGSKEVFKKVSNAYSTLIDPEKKATYDRYGPEEDREPQYRPQRHYRQGYTQQDEFEQIFRAFFGGMPRQGGHYQNNHYQHFTFNMGGPRAGNNNQGNGGTNMIFFLILIFVVYILPVFFSKQQPLFSTTASTTYRYQKQTPMFQAPYFVREEYFTQNKNGKYTKTIEQSVDMEFFMKLRKECEVEQWTRNRGAAANTKKNSCLKLQALQQKYQEYIRHLFYSY